MYFSRPKNGKYVLELAKNPPNMMAGIVSIGATAVADSILSTEPEIK